MNRTVRCLALFAIGVGAWACKGDPQSSLNRGDITSVKADPARILVDAGATTPVLVDARDNLNQAVEITSVTEAAGSGISFVRDWLFQPVFDANATTVEACGAIANSEWTGAGCLVPRTNPTRLRYEITGTALSETSFAVTINGSTTIDIPVTVTVPTTLTGALSNVAPASGDDVTLTLPAGSEFDPTIVADPTMWQIVTVGSNTAVVSDLQASVATFQIGPNISGTVSAGPVILPANPAVPPLTVTTSETFTSPQFPAPFAMTLSSNSVTGFDLVTATAGPGLIFDQTSTLFVGDPGVGCPIDPSCVPVSIQTRAPDGSTIDGLYPQNKTGSIYVTAMAAAGAPQFATLTGESDQTITIAATTVGVTVTQGLPASSGVGLEVVRLTLTDPGFAFDPSAAVTGVSGGVEFMNVGVDPGGTWVEYVPQGGLTGTPTVSGILFGGFQFQFPASAAVTAPASTFGPTTTQAGAPDITALLPATGVSAIFWDDGSFGGDVFGADRLYNFSGPIDHTFVLDWSNSADIDFLYADNPATAGFTCGGGATGAQPETSICVLAAGGWTMALNLYAGAAPGILELSMTGN